MLNVACFLSLDWANRSALHNYFDTESASFEEPLDLRDRAGLACLWDTSKFDDNGTASVLAEALERLFGTKLQR